MTYTKKDVQRVIDRLDEILDHELVATLDPLIDTDLYDKANSLVSNIFMSMVEYEDFLKENLGINVHLD